jgi:4-amino-4-deoxy-L-arabinose transferase-like glycosyltransferase
MALFDFVKLRIAQAVAPGRVRRSAILLLSIALLVSFAIVWQTGINSGYSRDYDEGVYLTSARMVAAGHPLFSSVFSSQPPVLVEMLALTFRLFGETVVTGRELIIFFSLITLLSVALIATHWVNRYAAPLTIVALALALTFFKLSLVVQAEPPALAFALLAILAILRARQRSWQSVWLIVGGMCFALGTLCKLFIAPLILPIAFLFLLSPQASGSSKWEMEAMNLKAASKCARRFLIFCLACGILLCVWLAFYEFGYLYDQVASFHLAMRQVFPLERINNLQQIGELLRSEIGLTLSAILGLIILFRKNFLAATWLCIWMIAVCLFAINHTPLYWRHLVLLLPPLALAAGASILWVPDVWRRPWSRPLLFLLLLPLFNYETGAGVGLSIKRDLKTLSAGSQLEEQNREVEKLIRQHTRPEDFVVSDEQIQVFLAGRLSPPQLCDTSYSRIKAGYLTGEQAIQASEGARMIIFSNGRLSQLPEYRQWVRSHFRTLLETEESGGLSEIYIQE